MSLVPQDFLASRQVRALLALLSVVVVAALVLAPEGMSWRVLLGLLAALLAVVAWGRTEARRTLPVPPPAAGSDRPASSPPDSTIP